MNRTKNNLKNLVIFRDKKNATLRASTNKITIAPVHKYVGKIAISASDNTIGLAYTNELPNIIIVKKRTKNRKFKSVSSLFFEPVKLIVYLINLLFFH